MKQNDKPVRDYDRFIVRFPEGMRDRLVARAKASGRSMNAEIASILADALDEPDEGRLQFLLQQRAGAERLMANKLEDADALQEQIKAMDAEIARLSAR
jgi:plasmid stability protein